MNLIEAYRCKKKVIWYGRRKAIAYLGALRWLNDNGEPDTYVTVEDAMIDGWELVPEPPKRYDFEKALAMMRQGKWMRPVGGNGCYNARSESGKWLESDTNGIIHSHCVLFALSNTDKMWEERQ